MDSVRYYEAAIDNQGYYALRDAIFRNDILRCNQLLQIQADIDGVDMQGNSLLHIATLYNNYEITYALLAHKAWRTTVNSDRNTPIHLAAEHGNEKIVRLLLDNGVSGLYTRNKNGQLPIHIAAQYGYMDVVKCLFECKNNYTIGLLNEEGNTPLHIAILYSHFDIAEFLIKNDLYQDIHNEAGFTALHYAAYRNNTVLIQLLLEYGANLAAKSKQDDALPLHIAARHGHVNSVEILANIGEWLINAKNKYKHTPLHFAVIGQHTSVVKLLVKKGASFNMKSRVGYTALHLAACYGYIDILEYLMSHPAKRQIKTKHRKYMPIHMAIHGGHLEAVRSCLKYKVSVNALTGKKETPLHIAAKVGDLDILKFLISQKADIYRVDYHGNTILQIAAQHGHIHMVEYLAKRYFSLLIRNTHTDETLLHSAVHSDNAQLVSFLLNKAPQLNGEMTKSGYTALHLAAMKGNEEIVLLLLHNGLPLYTKSTDSNENIALHWAAYYGHVHIVDILLNKGHRRDQLTQINALGYTALHIAVMRGYLEVSKFLFAKNKFNLQVRDKEGKTPFSLAFQHYKPTLLPYITLMLTYRAESINYEYNQLDESEKNCLQGLSAEVCNDLTLHLKDFFLYCIMWEKVLCSLQFSGSMLPSQQNAVNFWMRCSAAEKSSLCFIAQSQWRFNSPDIQRNIGWRNLPLEIRQRIIYLAFQDKLNVPHLFQSYLGPAKWMAATGSLITQLSFFKLGEVPSLSGAANQSEEVLYQQSKQRAEVQAHAIMSFYRNGR